MSSKMKKRKGNLPLRRGRNRIVVMTTTTTTGETTTTTSSSRFLFLILCLIAVVMMVMSTTTVVVVVAAAASTTSRSPSSSTSRSSRSSRSSPTRSSRILVVGSANVDTFLPLERLPTEGENVMTLSTSMTLTESSSASASASALLYTETEADNNNGDDVEVDGDNDGGGVMDVPGGKGLTQAVACSRLLLLQLAKTKSSTTNCDTSSSDVVDSAADDGAADHAADVGGGVSFWGQFGNDHAGQILQETLRQNNVSYGHLCGIHSTHDTPDTHGMDTMQQDRSTTAAGTSSSSSKSKSMKMSTGRGYVFWIPSTGSVSAVVSGGTNMNGWIGWNDAWEWKMKMKHMKNDMHNKHMQSQERSDRQKEQHTKQQHQQQLVKDIRRQLFDDDDDDDDSHDDNEQHEKVSRRPRRYDCIMLQCEVPEYVNLLIAHIAKQSNNNSNDSGNSNNNKKEDDDESITVVLDIGGEDRPISSDLLKVCDYVIPNESELLRLVKRNSNDVNDVGGTATNDKATIIDAMEQLQRQGASNVLVTRGSKGSILLTSEGRLFEQPAIPVHRYDQNTKNGEEGQGDDDGDGVAGVVVDETGAGDCYRAAFCVALMEGHSIEDCLKFASAAGSCSVQVHGAVPSAPTRSQVLDRLSDDTVLRMPRGGGGGGSGEEERDMDDSSFPYLIGSRLNSMKDRPELWTGHPLETPRDFVKRQSKVKGLTCVDFNYPQHFESYWTPTDARKALDDAGLKAGAVCLRYPSKFARGAMNHPDLEMRKEAIKLTKEAAEVAMVLGCDEVVIWSAFDGYDYPFQVDYDEKWDQLVDAFRECCDEYPEIKFSLEYKPTDENTRFFTVPSTGAALMFVSDVDRPNIGLTLDVGHMLMSGENPGQSLAMAARREKLFGIQLNDGWTRLAAEDGLMFGSVHPSVALEIMYTLVRTKYKGHLYFDTFPQRTDPILEAEYNIRQVKRYWMAAQRLVSSNDYNNRVRKIMDEHDAVGALELIDDVLSK